MSDESNDRARHVEDVAIAALQKAWDWIAANRVSVESLPDKDEHGRTYKDGASWGLAYAKRRIEIEIDRLARTTER